MRLLLLGLVEDGVIIGGVLFIILRVTFVVAWAREVIELSEVLKIGMLAYLALNLSFDGFFFLLDPLLYLLDHLEAVTEVEIEVNLEGLVGHEEDVGLLGQADLLVILHV